MIQNNSCQCFVIRGPSLFTETISTAALFVFFMQKQKEKLKNYEIKATTITCNKIL